MRIAPILSWWQALSRWEQAAFLVWSIAISIVCTRAYLFPTRQTVWHDYGAAGRAWIAGADAYNLDQYAGQFIPPMSGYRYAPIVSVLLVPFSMFPDDIAGVLWRLFNVGCYLGAFWWFAREAASMSDRRARAILWLLLIPLSLGSINNGQANVLLMGLLLAAGASVVRERWNLAAAFLAGACLLKLYPIAIAMLLILVYPRMLGWRFFVAMAVGLALPFAFQAPSYVTHQYENWFTLVASDNRSEFPLTQGYRDFYLLTRALGTPLEMTSYRLIQLSAAGLVASVCLLVRFRDVPASVVVTAVLTLGCAWMVVFGPSVESSTFIQIAPVVALALVETKLSARPRWSTVALYLVFALLTASHMTAWTRTTRDWLYLAQPICALVFLAERLARHISRPAANVPSVQGATSESAVDTHRKAA